MEAQAHQDGTAALPVRQFTPEELAVFYQDLHPTPRPALPMSMHSPNQLKVMRVIKIANFFYVQISFSLEETPYQPPYDHISIVKVFS